LSATPNGKNHLRRNHRSRRGEAMLRMRQTLLSEDTSCGIPRTALLGRPRFPASVTQLVSSQLSINKRHRRSSDPPATKSVPLPRLALAPGLSPSVQEMPGGDDWWR